MTFRSYSLSRDSSILRCDVQLSLPDNVDMLTDAQLEERARLYSKRLEGFLEFRVHMLQGPMHIHDAIQAASWRKSKLEPIPEWETSYDELWRYSDLDLGMTKLEPGMRLGNVTVHLLPAHNPCLAPTAASTDCTMIGFDHTFSRAISMFDGMTPTTPPEAPEVFLGLGPRVREDEDESQDWLWGSQAKRSRHC